MHFFFSTHVTFLFFSYYKGRKSNKKQDEYEKGKRGVLWGTRADFDVGQPLGEYRTGENRHPDGVTAYLR